jgi:exosome complex component RRP42
MSSIILRIKKKQISDLIAEEKRIDGRKFTENREIKVEQGILQKAEGSARVHFGKTEVIVGVKIEVGQPFPDTPNKGVMTVNAELSPLASPLFEPGPPNENAIEIARIVDRGIREAQAIDVEKLCIEPGKKVFVVFIDVWVLNHDGNLIDASALAAISALFNTKMFNYEIKDGEVEITSGYNALPVRKRPIAVTFAKIDDKILVDPGFEEEQVMDARITVTIEDDGNVCAMQKGGKGSFTLEEILAATKIAKEKADAIRKDNKW